MDKKYKCTECGWIGTEKEMKADFFYTDDGECWTNWKCPKCDSWWQLEDYEEIF